MKEWSKNDITKVIENSGNSVIYFYTPLCGTCAVASKMLNVVERLITAISFAKVDLNYMPEMAEQFSIESVPCLIIIKEGKPIEKVYAFQSVPYLYELINGIYD
ncbi:thioredoxin family protein [Bacillus sp. FJAT-50079]|uniref:thioredoxin family protein n=1 Tax=Bacillus sp. FJAT-50079 TaxID=2833577 RepID=UPI001BC9A993|nr:thioredoxin family protein [Bacillus sp. FJAT-50079]MBS4208504.1 thioredoxin family protein [Bacillus sp. FJAT-50079]